MILVVDVGNTNIVLAVYENDKFCFDFRFKTDPDKIISGYANEILKFFNKENVCVEKIDGAIISSVVPKVNKALTDVISQVCKCKVKLLDSRLKTGLKICTDYPEKVGADLICGAAMAYNKYKSSVIVFDFGTATTVCAVDNLGNYLGHSICPGVWTSFRALSEFTAKLPKIEKISDGVDAIGKNTVSSIESGVIIGTACIVDGMTKRYKKELGGNTKVVATGGLSEIILPYCETEINLWKNLLLDGLNFLYKLNL